MAGPCDTQDRARQVSLINRNQYWTIEIGTFQLLNGFEYPGYITDTGVVVAGLNVGPGSTSNVDPCIAKGSPIMPRSAKASMNVTYKGESRVVTIPDRTAAPGRYMTGFQFGLNPSPNIVEGEIPAIPEAFIEPLEDEAKEL